jgi:hypothetical protein
MIVAGFCKFGDIQFERTPHQGSRKVSVDFNLRHRAHAIQVEHESLVAIGFGQSEASLIYCRPREVGEGRLRPRLEREGRRSTHKFHRGTQAVILAGGDDECVLFCAPQGVNVDGSSARRLELEPI